MFSRQTISKDPVAVIPSVFDIVILLGWFSYPVVINVTPNNPVLDSVAWHSVVQVSVTPSTPELLLIPWIAEAIGTVTPNNPELTDSLLLGEAHINITVAIASLNGATDLAPSWYIRQPHQNNTGLPYGVSEHLDPVIDNTYTDADIKNAEDSIIPWGEFEDTNKLLSGNWNFLQRLDIETGLNHEDFADQFVTDITQGYSYPETKDIHESLRWGMFDDLFASDFQYGYSHPAIKDLGKVIPWGLFGDTFNKTFGLDYHHPPALDVFKTIYCGPNWFPKWCINQFLDYYGEVTFDFVTSLHQAYDQYFPAQTFAVNPKEIIETAQQLFPLPELKDRANMFPSGDLFGRHPLATKSTSTEFRGATGMTVSIESGHLEYPIYFNDKVENYEQICFDGYRTGPQDKYDYKPVYYKVVIPNIRSYYIVMNTVSLKRVSDDAIIPITDIDISMDMDSWCWSMSANVRRKVDLELVRPAGGAPIEVEASINGNTWRFIIESYGENRGFGSYSYSITGRSPSSMLSAPYTAPEDYIQTTQVNAAQLAYEILDGTGYTRTWNLTDWQISANTFSVNQQTPIQQLLAIAQAAGGVLHSDPTAKTISMLPRYATMPWDWGGAVIDAALPTFATRSTSYQAQPQYSGVYVSGQAEGVVCFVKRASSDGSDQPQMVVDPLITATEVGLQRGSAVLAASGCRSLEQISAPFLDDPGLLTPGMLIEVTDPDGNWRGQVMSTQLTAHRPVVTQTLSVLRYHGD